MRWTILSIYAVSAFVPLRLNLWGLGDGGTALAAADARRAHRALTGAAYRHRGGRPGGGHRTLPSRIAEPGVCRQHLAAQVNPKP